MAGWLLVLRDHRTAKADFVSLAVAEQLASSTPERLYDIEVQLDLQRQLAGDTQAAARPFVNPPFVAQFAQLVIRTDMSGGYVRLALLNLLAIAGIGWALCRSAPGLGPLRHGLMILGMVGALPVATGMSEGTVSLLVGLGLALVLVGERNQRDWWCASGLAIATMKPHLCLVALLVLGCRGRVGALGRFALLGTGIVVTSVATIGLKPWLAYPRALLQMSGEAAPERRYSLRWWNLLTPIRVLFGPVIEPMIPGLSVVVLLTGLIALGALLRKQPDVPTGIAMVGLTLCLPHVNGHDLAWLPVAFAMVWGADSWKQRRRSSRALLLTMATMWAPLTWFLWPSRSSTLAVGSLVTLLILTLSRRTRQRSVTSATPSAADHIVAA